MTNLHPFGPAYRLLRESRGLTLKQAAGDVCSAQFLGRFERGDTGISLDNFARLLIILGIEWKEFANTFARLGGDCLEFPPIEFAKNIKNEEDIIRYMPTYEKLFDTYLQDNPMQGELLLKAIKLRHYPTIPKTPESVAKIQHIIDHLMAQEVFSTAELEVYILIVNHCPLEMVNHMKNRLLESYKESQDTDTYIRLLNCLTYTAKHLSEQGYYQSADELIKQIKSLQTYERGYLSTPLLFLEVEHVYNQFRWNKPEAIGLARNLLTYLDSAKFIDSHYYSSFIQAFTHYCHKLNKTGEDLF